MIYAANLDSNTMAKPSEQGIDKNICYFCFIWKDNSVYSKLTISFLKSYSTFGLFTISFMPLASYLKLTDIFSSYASCDSYEDQFKKIQ